ncbi:hypothetical protein Tco_0405513 [Tanacetum coccineum]
MFTRGAPLSKPVWTSATAQPITRTLDVTGHCFHECSKFCREPFEVPKLSFRFSRIRRGGPKRCARPDLRRMALPEGCLWILYRAWLALLLRLRSPLAILSFSDIGSSRKAHSLSETSKCPFSEVLVVQVKWAKPDVSRL